MIGKLKDGTQRFGLHDGLSLFRKLPIAKETGEGRKNSECAILNFSDMESIFGARADGSCFQGAVARAGAEVGVKRFEATGGNMKDSKKKSMTGRQ